jgi:hypothetical protein
LGLGRLTSIHCQQGQQRLGALLFGKAVLVHQGDPDEIRLDRIESMPARCDQRFLQYRPLIRTTLIFDSLDVGVQRPDIVAIPNIDLFRDLLASLDDL